MSHSPVGAEVWQMLTRDQRVLAATHTFIHKWNESYLPLTPTAQCHYTLPGTHSAEGRRLSWPGLLGFVPSACPAVCEMLSWCGKWKVSHVDHTIHSLHVCNVCRIWICKFEDMHILLSVLVLCLVNYRTNISVAELCSLCFPQK